MKSTIASVIVSIALVAGAVWLTRIPPANTEETRPINNVSIVDGKQVITIRAKEGYWPRRSAAEAGLPTILRFDTEGTFDCSAFVSIPSANINKVLSQSGATDIDIGIAQEGTMQGMCNMGMYPFEVVFQKETQ